MRYPTVLPHIYYRQILDEPNFANMPIDKVLQNNKYDPATIMAKRLLTGCCRSRCRILCFQSQKHALLLPMTSDDVQGMGRKAAG